MEAIIESLNNLSTDQLNQLEKICFSLRESKVYFSDIEQCGYVTPELRQLVIDGKIKVKNVLKNTEMWFGYEDGYCYDIVLQIEGIDSPVKLRYITHSTKYTYTECRKITLDDKLYNLSFGDDKTNYRGNGEQEGIYVLQKLHEALDIPKKNTALMLHLLFFPYSHYPYIEDEVNSLED